MCEPEAIDPAAESRLDRPTESHGSRALSDPAAMSEAPPRVLRFPPRFFIGSAGARDSCRARPVRTDSERIVCVDGSGDSSSFCIAASRLEMALCRFGRSYLCFNILCLPSPSSAPLSLCFLSLFSPMSPPLKCEVANRAVKSWSA